MKVCTFFVEFLACVHLHTDDGDLGEISRTKTIRMVPLLCGLASRFEENIESLHCLPLPGTSQRARRSSSRLSRTLVQKMRNTRTPRSILDIFKLYIWVSVLVLKVCPFYSSDSPITFLHCIHESRMKKIHLLPPPSEKQIYIVQTKMAIHDIVSLAYYLENFDR